MLLSRHAAMLIFATLPQRAAARKFSLYASCRVARRYYIDIFARVAYAPLPFAAAARH